MREMPQDIPSYADLMAREDKPRGSAWGVFGDDDELGTINFQTPETVLAAARSIRQGALFNLDCPLDAFDPPTSHQRSTCQHRIFGNNPHHRDDVLDNFYLQSSSQIDALRHMRHPIHGFYNGVPDEDVAVGSARLGIGNWAESGIAGRGVLIDLDRYYRGIGAPLDQDSNQPIPISAIEEASRLQGVDIRPGDIVMLRTGWLNHYFNARTAQERANFYKDLRSPGLLQSRETLAWLWDKRVSVIAADNPGIEAIPPASSSPFAAELENVEGVSGDQQARLMHPQLIAMLGLVLGELWNLDDLTHACERDGQWDCFVTIKPLYLRGGVGSPANVTAIR
jgi:kynurenine formamidase